MVTLGSQMAATAASNDLHAMEHNQITDTTIPELQQVVHGMH